MEKEQKIYNTLFDLIEKNRDILHFTDYEFKELKLRSERYFFGLKLKEEFGFNINPRDQAIRENFACLSIDYEDYKIYIRKHNHGEISCSDDKKQPNDGELLLYIRFPTGAYIFGDHYPKELFNDFFDELKTFEPKYTDTMNSSLYFSMDKAGKFYNNFKKILNKYHDKNKEIYKKIRAEELRKELEKLEK